MVFYVDELMQSQLMQDNDLSVELADAVSAELHWDRPTSMFGWLEMRCRHWKAGSRVDAPPVLPLLAVSVLAASKMATEGDTSSSNYYKRLAEVFRVDTLARDNLRSYSKPVADMWETLDEWMTSRGGERGYSTISGDSHLTRIGYPMSQALLREQDRRVLTAFFAAVGIKPGAPQEFPGEEIIRRLRLWTASNQRRLSRPLLKTLSGSVPGAASADKRLVLADLLERLVEHWDGTLYEGSSGGRRATALRLALSRRSRQLRWVPEAVSGVSAATVRDPDSGAQYKLDDPYGGYYAGLEELEVTASQLAHGMVLEGADLYLVWTAQPLIFFTEDEYSGDFVSTGAFRPGEKHMLMTSNDELQGVQTVLAEIAEDGWCVDRKRPLDGWTLFKKVDLKAAITPAALLRGDMPQASHFVPTTRRGFAFEGGLRIGRDLGRHHYLRGGVPDWLLPRDVAQGDTAVRITLSSVDGTDSHVLPVYDLLRPFPARSLSLADGTYVVSASGTDKVTFTVSSELCGQQNSEAGSIGHRCDARAGTEGEDLDREAKAIRGAEAPEKLTLPRTLMVPSGVKELVLVGANGELHPLDLPDPPDWAGERLADESHGCREVSVDAGCVWAIQHWRQGTTTVRPLAESGKEPAPNPSSRDTKWAETVLAAASAGYGTAWGAYVAAAREVGK
ncbi:hypothetical protein AB0E78_24955 [Streptomyces sp. NPDC032198]|uniref:hypothetical protein n=1 Tax=Streptomyces sp. NPDC032198 TaxID=3155127 RepID=UPI0033C14292